MSKRLFQNRWLMGALGGACLVLAFPPFEIFPLLFLFPLFLNWAIRNSSGFWQGVLSGLVASLVIMLGAFYWVTYTIHEFGHLPWWLSILIFLAFCSFGALNFPLFVGLGVLFRRVAEKTGWIGYSLGIPALFTLVEYAIPKLFPWYSSNALYRLLPAIQIVEITGVTFLTFIVYSLGSSFDGYLWLRKKRIFMVPLALWTAALLFGVQRLSKSPSDGRSLRVSLIQANIGSLEKVEAERGFLGKRRKVIDTYKRLTERALLGSPPPELILWPETAMPFQMESKEPIVSELKASVIRWGVPLITGGYSMVDKQAWRDYNAAFLLDPTDGKLRIESYAKNVLLAFGEEMPFSDTFPYLKRIYAQAQVSSFERGKSQDILSLSDGTRLGVTICYEAIIPGYVRKVARNQIQALINLTNDSWYGPTSEPYQHAALAVFRSIEARVPLIRVTNTGISYWVDSHGRMVDRTAIFEEAILSGQVMIPSAPPSTLYLKYGDWFVGICVVLIVGIFLLSFRKAPPQ